MILPNKLIDPRKLAGAVADTKDTYKDKLYIKHLVKAIQKVDQDIGAFIYENTMTVVFFRNNIIIYKLKLDEFNTSIPIEKHAEKVKTLCRMIDINMIPLKQLRKNLGQVNYKLGTQL